MLNTKRAGQEAELLALYIDAASAAVEERRQRLFHAWPAMPTDPDVEPPEPAIWRVALAGRRMVRIPDARELVSVTVDGAAVTSELESTGVGGTVAAWWGFSSAPGCQPSGYRLYARPGHPAHAILLPGAGGGVLELQGYFGFHPTPPGIRLAVLQWAHRVYNEVLSRGADQVADPEGGAWAYFRQIPAGIASEIDRYWIPGL